MNKQQISQGLRDIGASFAIRSDKFVAVNDPQGSKPSYHIHPDASYPHEQEIIHFDSLKDIEEWIRCAKVMSKAKTEQEALSIRYAYEDKRDRRLQARQDRLYA